MSEWTLVLSCEHGGNAIPLRWAHLFSSARAQALLRSHRGWDRGALELSHQLSRALRAPLVTCTTSRLLVDANRPADHPRAFSRFTRELPEAEKRTILRAAHEPHWRAVRRAIALRRRVFHLSVHSFTPMFGGMPRTCDAGLLYDPRRSRERALCERWQALLAASAPGLQVRRNYPYRGVSAALTTSLRGIFAQDRYLGVELEVNQAFWTRRTAAARALLASELTAALMRAITQP